MAKSGKRATNRPDQPFVVKSNPILDAAAELARAMFRKADRQLEAKLAAQKSKSDDAG